jgi:hypothetical protein
LAANNRLPQSGRPAQQQDLLRARLSARGQAGGALRAREGVKHVPEKLLAEVILSRRRMIMRDTVSEGRRTVARHGSGSSPATPTPISSLRATWSVPT